MAGLDIEEISARARPDLNRARQHTCRALPPLLITMPSNRVTRVYTENGTRWDHGFAINYAEVIVLDVLDSEVPLEELAPLVLPSRCGAGA